MDILYLLYALWRKKWIIIIIPIISVAVAVLLTMNLKPTYKSNSQIATGFTTNEGVSVTDERFNLREVDLKFNNLLAVMKSGTILNMVSYKMTVNRINKQLESGKTDEKFTEDELLLAESIFQSYLRKQESFSIEDENSKLLRDILNDYGFTFNFFRNGFDIKRQPNTDFIQVSFVSGNPDRSAEAVNTYCDEFLRYYATTKRESSSESVTFFEELKKRKKDELDAKNQALKVFKSNNNLLTGRTDGDSRSSQLYELESQRDQINNNIYGLTLKLEDYRTTLSEKTSGNSNISTSNSNERILNIKKKIDNLNEKFISSGSNNAQLLDSLNLLRQQYKVELGLMERGSSPQSTQGLSAGEIRDLIKSTEIELQVQESRLSDINYKINSIRGSLSSYANNEAILSTLERDVEVASNEYLAAVEKFNEAQNKLMASAGSIRQVYKAVPPASPEPSKRFIIIILAGFATFGLCVFVIILLEIIDTSIKTPAQFERLTGLRLSGSLVKIDTKKLNYLNLFTKKQEQEELEQFKHFLRKIRYEIENDNAKTFLITSTKVGVGKTFVIFSLAFVLSMIKKRVLIIDTNFKNNALSKWLIPAKKKPKFLDQGKTDRTELKLYNEGQEEESQTHSEVELVQPTKHKNIYIIGNGGGFESPEEIFFNKDFKSLIQGLSNKFDYILLEGSALNDYSDSKELVKYVDKIIPVFSAQETIKQLDKDSIAYLQKQPQKLSGAILNFVDHKNLNI
ncbi:exopolysaccharide transport family protein [Marivirga harenae]|uniref:exopolysaccharide transport family protein n=1 Tax=Marivirga harenae TaxID=2010992 RepID=UPI0026E0F859|nr:Wzz/FepE/Etk N-terminal domain-containing protein [Marivirga harenae]WKV12885.1 Wzz/FepE/Etk N-terminal domain-containing protein [Marivirga harenae]